MNNALTAAFIIGRKRRRRQRVRGELNLALADMTSKKRFKFAPHWHARNPDSGGCTDEGALQTHINFEYDSINSMAHNIDHNNEHIHIIPGREHRGEGQHGIIEHTLVLYNEVSMPYDDYQRRDNLMFRAHPNDPGRPMYTVAEMADQFDRYSNMVGLEMFSRNATPQPIQGDPHHTHRRGEGQYVRSGKIWDELLTDYGLKVFGIGATDAYCDHPIDVGDNHFNTAWTELLTDDLEEETVKQAFLNGHFFAVSHMDTSKKPPKVTDIQINSQSIDLTVTGEYEQIYWVYNHELVGTGNSFDLSEWQGNQNYIRYEVWSKSSDYWENNQNIMENPFDSPFYSANIVIGQPIFQDDLI